MNHTLEQLENYQDSRNVSLHLPEPPEYPSPPLYRHVLFQLSVRLIIYCLLVQSILPSFAWAAASVEAPSLEASSLSPSSSLLYLPHIYQEAEAQEEGQPSREIQESLPFHAIDISSQVTIKASISHLKTTYGDLYKSLKYVADSVEWLNYGLVFRYSTQNHILSIAGADEPSKLGHLRIKGIGKIALQEGVLLGALEAPKSDIENKGQATYIKTLISKTFKQKENKSLNTLSLTCHENLENEGEIISEDKSASQLHLVVSGTTINKGTIKAATVTGVLKELHNHGTVQADFSNLTIKSLHNYEGGHVLGNGTIRVGKGVNEGNIQSTALTLDLYQGEFLNEGIIASTQTLKTVGKGVLREGKGSHIITPHWHINNRVYEKDNENESHKYDKVTVGKAVRRWATQEGSTLSARTIEFFASKKAKKGGLHNGGTFLVDHFINHATHFQNAGDMHLGTWEQKGKNFHNAQGSLDVTGNATFTDVQHLLNEGDIDIHGKFLGKIAHLANREGKLVVKGDFDIQGETFVNEKVVRLMGLGRWVGRIFTNRGVIGIRDCDFVVRQLLRNEGTFFWSYYSPRAWYILNFGWMERTLKIMQDKKTLRPTITKEWLASYNPERDLAVENHGTINLQSTYRLKPARHRPKVKFQHWDNKGTFLDKSRHLQAETFNNTGDYRSAGALTGNVKNFISTNKLCAASMNLTSERVKLSGLLESQGKVSLATNHFEDESSLKMTVQALEVRTKATSFTERTSLTISGDIQVTQDLTLAADRGRITGKITQREGRTTFKGIDFTLAPRAEFNVDWFYFAGTFRLFSVDNTLTMGGLFSARVFSGHNLHVLKHESRHPLVLQGGELLATYIDSLNLTGTGHVRIGTGQYHFGNLSNSTICEIHGDVNIKNIANHQRLHLGTQANLRIHKGDPGIIEAPTGVKLFLPGAEDAEDKETKGAKVVCLSDEVAVPTLHTRAQSTIYLDLQHNVIVN